MNKIKQTIEFIKQYSDEIAIGIFIIVCIVFFIIGIREIRQFSTLLLEYSKLIKE